MMSKIAASILVLFTIAFYSARSSDARDVVFDWQGVVPAPFSSMGSDSASNIYLYSELDDELTTWLLKFDPSWQPIWSRTFVPPWPKPQSYIACHDGILAIDRDDNVYVTVRMYAGDFEVESTAIIKYDARGRRLWVRRIVSACSEAVNAMATDGSGNLYLAGKRTHNPETERSELFVAKYDGSGTLLWTQYFGSPEINSRPRAMAVDGDGNVVVSASLYNRTTEHSGLGLIKFSSAGERLWIIRFGDEPGASLFFPVFVDESNNVFTAMTTHSDVSRQEISLFKYSSSGALVWKRSFQGPENTMAQFDRMVKDSLGNFILLGRHIDEARDIYQMLLLKVDANGVRKWTRTYGAAEDQGPFTPSEIVLDAEDNAFILGHFGFEEIDIRWPGGWGTRYGNVWEPYMVKYATDGKRLFGYHSQDGHLFRDGSGNVYLRWYSEDDDKLYFGQNPH